MKLIYGYLESGRFLVAVAGDAMANLIGSEDTVEGIKEMLSGCGESVVDFSRQDGQKISKHLKFGKKGDVRTLDVKK